MNKQKNTKAVSEHIENTNINESAEKSETVFALSNATKLALQAQHLIKTAQKELPEISGAFEIKNDELFRQEQKQ
ncbi:hypothetical protein [Pseudoalteromonas denitrificans]|uniref:Uncharacterized protein n=1 Tax=Pseudoalteromonas denitrificans DSM 6059 TaxID=1123010 RepID=A0A1I1T997_9GAMM|nr:hypothetical protein [Pseudoalteromonas denitrificans]SFD55155.1 hypothetical protein SAMN02745724_04827 [Pseudoalteromonas denitrificans DSM 6059]